MVFKTRELRLLSLAAFALIIIFAFVIILNIHRSKTQDR